MWKSIDTFRIPLQYTRWSGESQGKLFSRPAGGARPPLDRRILVVHIEKAGEKDEAEPQEGREESDPFQNFQAGAGDSEKNDGDAQEHIPESVLQHEHPLAIKIAEPETRTQVPGC